MTGGYGKSISHVIIGLKTVKGTKQLKLDPTIYDALIKEKVSTLVLPLFFPCLVNPWIHVRDLKLISYVCFKIPSIFLYSFS